MPDDASLSKVQEALRSAGARWQAGETPLSRLSLEEFRAYLGYDPGPGDPTLEAREELAKAVLAGAERAPQALAPGAVGAPASFDWRNAGGRNFMTPVKDQGACGSCVAFGSSATVEATLRCERNDPALPVDLSEAHLFYCIARSQGRMCGGPNGGWWVPNALDAFKNPGVTDEPCYPYTGGDQMCSGLAPGWAVRATRIIGWHQVTNQADMKSWLANRGPLATCFTVYDDFRHYTSGVYQHVWGAVAGGHCVSVVGYDDSQGCWICKNSWGTGFGEQGYFRIQYGDCGIDATMWAVDAVLPPPGFGSGIGTINNADGRMEVFVRGLDGASYHKWQTSAGGGWSGWDDLGGILTSKHGVGRNADGRLEIFVRGTDNAVWHNWQTSAGGGWSGWDSLGGVITSDPAVGINADGRLEVFARGTDNALWHIWQTSPGGGWSGWASLGGIIMGDPVVGRDQDGRMEVFVRGSDYSMFHMWQTARNNGWSGWSGMGGIWTSDAAVVNNADGRLEVFARGTDRALYHIWQLWPNGPWTPWWSSLGGIITSDPAAGRNADGRLEVFASGTDFAVWHRWQNSPGGGWSGWDSLGGIVTSYPALGQNQDGRLEVFVRGTDNALYHQWQTSPNNGWSGWDNLGGGLTSSGIGDLDLVEAVTIPAEEAVGVVAIPTGGRSR